MKTSELLVSAGKYFDNYPDAESVLVTEDGTAFHADGMNYAVNHSLAIGGQVHKFGRLDLTQGDPDDPKTNAPEDGAEGDNAQATDEGAEGNDAGAQAQAPEEGAEGEADADNKEAEATEPKPKKKKVNVPA